MADPPERVEHSIRSAHLSPTALSLLGLEQAGLIRGDRVPRTEARMDRRINSYYNHFRSRTHVCNDFPPTYAASCRQARIPTSPRFLDNGREILPKYTCTVFKEGPMSMLVESISPFMGIPLQEWRQVYVVLQGTALWIHKLKTTTVDKQHLHEAGKLLRIFTLQHAEVGLAPDVDHTTVVPLTRFASLIPSWSRRKAYDKDPSSFRAEKHYAMRVRAELDQFVLTHLAEEQIMSWINHISAGIDISPAIDERSVPRQCTMPRRRRRAPRPLTLSDLNDERFIDEQRRLLSRYNSNDSPGPQSPASPNATSSSPNPDQGEEEVDLSAIAEEGPTTPTEELYRTLSQPASPFHASPASTNFSIDGKWTPPHPRSLGQQWRYIRRCMPVLLPDTPRHSSVMVNDGAYVRPNYKLETLDRWVLTPPAYEAHEFATDADDDASADGVEPADSVIADAPSRSGSSQEIQRLDSTASTEAMATKAFAVEELAGAIRAIRPSLAGRRGASKLSTTSTESSAAAAAGAREEAEAARTIVLGF